MFLRNLLLAIGALALLTGVVLGTLWFLQPAPKAVVETVSTQPRQSILVAAKPIAAGTLLRHEDMRWKETIPTDISAAYLIRGQVAVEDYAGAVARRSFAAGEPLTASALVKSSERGFLAAVLGPGMRAVAISVDAPQSAAGMILPGDHVDAILTQKFSDTTPAARRSVGETILRNLRVVAVDQWMKTAARPISDKGVGTADTNIPKTITLEVSQTDAEKLMVAVELGTISFSLRALQSGAPGLAEATNVPIWASDVSRAFGAEGPTISSPAPGALRGRTPVEIVRGSKTQTH